MRLPQLFRILGILLICNCSRSSSYNVLIWSATLGQSHVNFMGNIADTLVDDGHNVSVLLVENDPDVTSSGTSKVRNVIRYVSPLVDAREWSQHNFKKGNVFSTQTFDYSDYNSMQDINYRICQSMLDDSSFLETLRLSKFDLVILEMFHFCPAGIFHLTNIPKVMMASALGMTPAHYDLLGFQPSLSFMPAMLTPYGSQMGFFERTHNAVFYWICRMFYNYMYQYEQHLFNSKYPGFPDLAELYSSKMDYLLLNWNELTETTRATLHSIKYIGGATTADPDPLRNDFEEIAASAQRGVVLFSLGSIVKSDEMPSHIKKAFLEAFQAFPEYNFIWKNDFGSNFTKPNVYRKSWVPQVDLLADKRVKLFITHGGMNSVQEALYFGVPMITMPIFADQDGNAALLAERGISITLNKFTVTKEAIISAIQKILYFDTSYREEANRAADILKGTPQQMRQDIAKYVRLSASNHKPHKHLRLQVDQLNWFQFYNLDVYLFLCLTVSTFVIVLCGLTYYVYDNTIPGKPFRIKIS